MKKIIFILSLLLIGCQVYSEQITIPQNTEIPLAFTQKILGKKVNPDDMLPVYVVKDVIVNGKVVFAQNSPGYLNVFDVKVSQYWKPGHYDGLGGYINIDGGKIQDVNGVMRDISYQEIIKGKDSDPYAVAQGMAMNANYYAHNPIIRQGQRLKAKTLAEFTIDFQHSNTFIKPIVNTSQTKNE